MSRYHRLAAPAILVGLGVLILLGSLFLRDAAEPAATILPTAGATAEPSPPIPSPTIPALQETGRATIVPSATSSATPMPPTSTSTSPPPPSRPSPSVTATRTAPPALEYPSLNGWDRFGVAADGAHIASAFEAGLRFGAYLDWNVRNEPALPERIQFWQMIRLREEGVVTPWEVIDAALTTQPGSVWMIGNEPDVIWQDNVTAGRYAILYHELYTYIKSRDPGALIAIAGVAQPTPLRMAYLDLVLESYEAAYGEPLPVDIWNVHAFILREEAGSWGVDIPPGMSDELAIRYEIEDHDNSAIFQQNLIAFRAWMHARGYGGHPLVVSEYGQIMPEDFGFSQQDVAEFMTASLDFFRTAVGETGYPPDEGRLVQWWFWFMLYTRDDGLSTGNLYDAVTGQLTPLGNSLMEYAQPYLSGND